ncbi:LDH2 family malate/lactate/ureidoglycolate dehydrogenase [Bacillus oleivorans]|uniref:LDH2 family malate/lactate/ureidoglycolate dehydrogenase n=1 Tax=Bacillus oleivorans TaxID=1448271 RepID=A0A285D6U3_9BACI|nr:Ldh family oxidoreductase [Bacillus oleivorans]SNX75522.1 LDH2 family malate/lactate/ureidoglycolate dehydrogenase [Bacillus oleivorans]
METQIYDRVLQTHYIDMGKKALMETGVSHEHAEIQMQSLLESDLRGVFSHGIFRLPRYLEQLKNKYINPSPNIRNFKRNEIIEVLDGDHGLGAIVGTVAMRKAIEKSKKVGVGVVACRKSNHFGTAAYYAEMASSENQIGIVLTNSSPIIAPTGSIRPLIGNNPWSISVPTKGKPITLDLANTIVAKGKLRIAMQNGESIPLGWALDQNGKPTTDPKEALKGVVLPIGEYKGYGIALMVEILAGIITGADFSVNMVDHDAEGKRNVGHLFISLNLEHFMEITEYYSRIEELIDLIKTSPTLKNDGVFLPGEKEWNNKSSQLDEYVTLPEKSFQVFNQLFHHYAER